MTPTRSFHPLTGDELKAVILADIKRTLDGDMRFAQHLTYPMIRWEWQFIAECYPNEPSSLNVDATGKIVNPGAEAAVVNVKGSRAIEAPAEGPVGPVPEEQRGPAPDEVRAEVGLHVPTTVMTKQGPVDDVFGELAARRNSRK